ncbi:MAG: antitoxin [Acidimicrobiales bacterium]
MRTTLDLDPAVLEELKRRRAAEGKPLGVIASELLSQAFSLRPGRRPDFVWRSQALELRVDLEDKDALWRALDER